MPSVGFSFVILGLVVGLVVASVPGGNQTSDYGDGYATDVNISSTTAIVTDGSVTPASTILNYSSKNSINTTTPTAHSDNSSLSTTAKPLTKATTKGDRDNSSMSSAKPKITVPAAITSPTSTKDKHGSTESSNHTGIIILIVVILLVIVFGFACFFGQRRARRYSVDPTFKPDEANIPLSTIDPDLPIEASSQNGLQTFESTETATIEPQEPGATAEVQKTEAAAESAASSPPADASEAKPKEAVAEQTPAVEEKTDDEDLVSNKTSVESLKETNENNSNNADLMATGVKMSNTFWDVPLNSPV
ncbi:hypothetical protein Q5P01_025377 [Channa striata]|uniref:Uncharacterized protein n=1 Tax=Channa striata TaxID=64152 RepID=A0AA88LLJ0_CHASR|nr:hypothetical protein Q5P01_025377 [Channa striata]